MQDASKSVAFSVFFGIALIYLFHINPIIDYGRNLPQVVAILDHGTLAMNDTMIGYRAYQDISQFEGKIYPGIAPGLSFVTVPLYAIFRYFLRMMDQNIFPGLPLQEESLLMIPITMLLAAIPAVLTSLMLFRFSLRKGLNRQTAYLVAILFSVGSPAFSYALGYNGSYHNITNFFALYAFIEIFRNHPYRPPRNYFLVGISIGLLPFFWYPAGITSIVLGGIFLYREPKGAVRYAAPAFFLPIIALLAYHWVTFGHPFSLPYHHRINPKTVGIGLGILGSTLPSLEIARKLLFGTQGGLFISFPLVVFSVYSARQFFFDRKKNDYSELMTAWAIFALYFLWNTTRTLYWDGGTGNFGPRYMLSSLPFLFVMMIYVLDRIPVGWVAPFAAFSILINTAGAHYRQPYDIDSLLLFLVKGPQFGFITWLNSMPASARVRFPDLFPASQWAFALGGLLFIGAYIGIVFLLRNNGPQSLLKTHRS